MKALGRIALFAHHRDGTTGVCDFLARLLVREGKTEIVYARFPFLFSRDGAIQVDRMKGRSAEPTRRSLARFYRPAPLSYLKDLVYALYYGLRFARGSDLFVGSTNILALAGIGLRRIGWVKRSVYLMIDYTPRRYPSALLNRLYYWIDRLAAEGSDRVWTLAVPTIDGRFRDGRLDRGKVRVSIVPFGNNSDELRPEDLERYDPSSIAYLGGVVPSKGAELFAPILKALAELGRGDVTLTCVGAGDLEFLKADARRLGVEGRLRVLGPVDSHEEVERILLRSAIAIAPYSPNDPNSFSFHADPGKVKIYLGCALPVVITDVPPFAREIQAEGAGVLAPYDAKAFAEAIAGILGSGGPGLKSSRARAFSMGTRYSWSSILSKALEETL